MLSSNATHAGGKLLNYNYQSCAPAGVGSNVCEGQRTTFSPFRRVGSRDHTQVHGLSNKDLYPLSHLPVLGNC